MTRPAQAVFYSAPHNTRAIFCALAGYGLTAPLHGAVGDDVLWTLTPMPQAKQQQHSVNLGWTVIAVLWGETCHSLPQESQSCVDERVYCNVTWIDWLIVDPNYNISFSIVF